MYSTPGKNRYADFTIKELRHGHFADFDGQKQLEKFSLSYKLWSISILAIRSQIRLLVVSNDTNIHFGRSRIC